MQFSLVQFKCCERGLKSARRQESGQQTAASDCGGQHDLSAVQQSATRKPDTSHRRCKQVAAVLTAKGRIAAVTYRIRLKISTA